MKVQIQSFADAGIAEKERVVISATGDHDIGKYLLFFSKKGAESNATSGRKTMYWFPDKPIKAGDLVVLYSKKGRRSEKKLDNGSTVHFFYWGLEAPIWGDDSKVAVLMQSMEWNTATPKQNGS